MSENVERKIYIQGAGGTIVSKSILSGKRPLKWLFREEGGYGNGWIAFGEGDDDEYVNNPDNMQIVDFNTLANIEPMVVNVFYMPIGTDLEFVSDKSGKYFIDSSTGRQIHVNPIQEAFEKNLKFLNKKEYPVEWIQGLFKRSKKIKPFIIGNLDCPTGELIAGDPLSYLGDEKCAPILNRKVPVGSYPVEMAIINSPIAGLRYAAARLKVTDKKVVKYECAMPKGYTIEQFNTPGVFSFFGVDAGIACFCDTALADEYKKFLSKFDEKNPNGNIYSDYFAEIFAESYKNDSENQHAGGDYIVWNIPDTNYSLPMFTSGLGDGVYSAYWGLDKDEAVVDVVIIFLNPEYFYFV